MYVCVSVCMMIILVIEKKIMREKQHSTDKNRSQSDHASGSALNYWLPWSLC